MLRGLRSPFHRLVLTLAAAHERTIACTQQWKCPPPFPPPNKQQHPTLPLLFPTRTLVVLVVCYVTLFLVFKVLFCSQFLSLLSLPSPGRVLPVGSATGGVAQHSIVATYRSPAVVFAVVGDLFHCLFSFCMPPLAVAGALVVLKGRAFWCCCVCQGCVRALVLCFCALFGGPRTRARAPLSLRWLCTAGCCTLVLNVFDNGPFCLRSAADFCVLGALCDLWVVVAGVSLLPTAAPAISMLCACFILWVVLALLFLVSLLACFLSFSLSFSFFLLLHTVRIVTKLHQVNMGRGAFLSFYFVVFFLFIPLL